MAERELREAMRSGDARALTTALERAEEEEVVDSRFLSEARGCLSSPCPTAAQNATGDARAAARATEELAATKRELEAAKAAAAANTRWMLLAAAAGAFLAAGLLALLGARQQRR